MSKFIRIAQLSFISVGVGSGQLALIQCGILTFIECPWKHNLVGPEPTTLRLTTGRTTYLVWALFT